MFNCVLIFLDMSGGEMIVIALVALLVLGPQKMGDFARKAGKMMNEVKRVSADFTSQLNEETGTLKDDFRGVTDTLRDAAHNIKNELTQTKDDVNNNLNVSSSYNINEPSNDVYNFHHEPAVTDPEPESAHEAHFGEHSATQSVHTKEQAEENPTSKPENTIQS